MTVLNGEDICNPAITTEHCPNSASLNFSAIYFSIGIFIIASVDTSSMESNDHRLRIYMYSNFQLFQVGIKNWNKPVLT